MSERCNRCGRQRSVYVDGYMVRYHPCTACGVRALAEQCDVTVTPLHELTSPVTRPVIVQQPLHDSKEWRQ